MPQTSTDLLILDLGNVVAANFAHSLIRKSPSAVGIETQEMLKAAFQAGVMFGLADRTAAYRMERFVQMETRANKLVSNFTWNVFGNILKHIYRDFHGLAGSSLWNTMQSRTISLHSRSR